MEAPTSVSEYDQPVGDYPLCSSAIFSRYPIVEISQRSPQVSESCYNLKKLRIALTVILELPPCSAFEREYGPSRYPPREA